MICNKQFFDDCCIPDKGIAYTLKNQYRLVEKSAVVDETVTTGIHTEEDEQQHGEAPEGRTAIAEEG